MPRETKCAFAGCEEKVSEHSKHVYCRIHRKKKCRNKKCDKFVDPSSIYCGKCKANKSLMGLVEEIENQVIF